MYPFRYAVSKPEDFDIIHIDGNPIKLTVYPLARCDFQKNANEAQWFCDHLGELFIFETTGCPSANPLHLMALDLAINWYATSVLDNPEMSIFKTGATYHAQKHTLN